MFHRLTLSPCHLVTLSFAAIAMAAAPLLAAPPATQPSAKEPTFHNPLILQRADGQVLRHTDGYYYYMGTVPEYDRLELRRAKSFNDLGATPEIKTIWKKHDTGPMGSHVWAPEIHFLDGKWYVYFAAGDAKNVWNIRLYVLENDSPNPLEGTWTEKGQLKTNWNDNRQFALDGTLFEHKGQRYFVWAEKDPTIRTNTNIYIAKMDSPTSIVGPGVMLSKPDLPWETVGFKVNEGPAVLIKNGKVFLTYSASATDWHYCLGMLTADENADLLDPKSWIKSPEPVLKTDENARVFGPGHNSFTTVDGFDVIMYHARNYKEIKGDPLHDPNRNQRAQVIHWNADGSPRFMPVSPDAQ